MIDWEGELHDQVDLAKAFNASFHAVSVPEQRLLGLCIESARDGLSLTMANEQLEPVSEQVLIAVSATDPVEVVPVGCAAAWSGSEFLVVWTEMEWSEGELTSRVGSVQARIVPMPALTR